MTAVVVDEALIDVEPGDTTERRYAIAFDLGTTTVVATLLDLGTGTPVAVASRLNKQQPFGGDVITRISATMMDPEALGRLQSPGRRDARRARPAGLHRGRCRPGPRLRGRDRRQRDHDRAGARDRPRAARGRAVRDDHVAPAGRARRGPRACTSTRARGRRCSPRSAPTSAATSSPGCWPPAWTATSAPGCSSTSAPTARSCSATATRSSPRRPLPARPSRAARSGAACAPPTAPSRWSGSTRDDGASSSR